MSKTNFDLQIALTNVNRVQLGNGLRAVYLDFNPKLVYPLQVIARALNGELLIYNFTEKGKSNKNEDFDLVIIPKETKFYFNVYQCLEDGAIEIGGASEFPDIELEYREESWKYLKTESFIIIE